MIKKSATRKLSAEHDSRPKNSGRWQMLKVEAETFEVIERLSHLIYSGELGLRLRQRLERPTRTEKIILCNVKQLRAVWFEEKKVKNRFWNCFEWLITILTPVNCAPLSSRHNLVRA
jgi:hypothetical protein